MRENLEVTMKNFKSLILGSAAGVLAVAGAQAADLPVKAKPAEYVKVCSAYGAGFYYIPGTDICLRIQRRTHVLRWSDDAFPMGVAQTSLGEL
jgi:hypothetical protein